MKKSTVRKVVKMFACFVCVHAILLIRFQQSAAYASCTDAQAPTTIKIATIPTLYRLWRFRILVAAAVHHHHHHHPRFIVYVKLTIIILACRANRNFYDRTFTMLTHEK